MGKKKTDLIIYTDSRGAMLAGPPGGAVSVADRSLDVISIIHVTDDDVLPEDRGRRGAIAYDPGVRGTNSPPYFASQEGNGDVTGYDLTEAEAIDWVLYGVLPAVKS